ncbi:retrotransposon protein [Cucumis melo var. makuwa]|uniref:Retrotransposon protein n=1 Tax=Cucumis melo var. makuwa TaxID=1194695 RepID=A0A5D3CKU0_CUCMM|nr:retrotransposon protein [Cucumis melo var. makuwa]
MTDCDDVDEGDSAYATTTATEDIHYIEKTNECMSTSSCASRHSHSASKGLLNKPFLYYDELVYVFGRDRATGRITETFTEMASNELGEYEGFDMPDENEEFPPLYS